MKSQKKLKKEKNNLDKQKNQKTINETKIFKQKYFDFYDDVKHYTKGKEDW